MNQNKGNSMKKQTEYLVSYQATKEDKSQSCYGNITITVQPYYKDTGELDETKRIIQENLGGKWSVLILNIIKFPIK